MAEHGSATAGCAASEAWIDLWMITPGPPDAAAAALLDAAERQRAERLPALAGRRFLAARAALRRILARYTGGSPAALRFELEPGGRPRLPDPALPAFSASRSADLLAVAVGSGTTFGLDIECNRPLPQAERIAAMVFAGDDNAALGRLPVAGRAAAVLRGWTRLEAALKAAGTGFAGLVQQPAIGLAASGPVVVTVAGQGFQVRDPLPGMSGIIASLAHRGPPPRLRLVRTALDRD